MLREASQAGRTLPADGRLATLTDVMSAPLAGSMPLGDVLVARSLGLVASRLVRVVEGAAHIAPDRDPFVLAISHGTRREAILVPTLLMLLRGGNRIHFLADWNFALIPGVGFLYRRAGIIAVTRKPARPRFLDGLRHGWKSKAGPFRQALDHIEAGRAVGIFPEGTVNRDPSRLLKGRPGAARLSLESGAPVVPVGLRYATSLHRGAAALGIIDVHIGPPLAPPRLAAASLADVRSWHGEIMTSIGALSRKAWEP